MSPEHIAHPYPTEQEKAQIMADTGIELKQLTNWFVNNRKRYWKPRVEARLQQQVQLPVTPSSIKRRTSSNTELTAMDVPSLLAPSMPSSPSASRRSSISEEHLKSLGVETSSPINLKSSLSQVVVSDASSSGSCASDTGSVFSSTNEDEMMAFEDPEDVDGTVSRCETVNVHILRPLNGVRPTIADVSILSSVPEERILYTYENVSLTYRFAADAIQDRKKVQSRRDAEIVRMKKQYLNQYLEETASSSFSFKRSMETSDEVEMSPRKKFCRISPGLWKEACKAAEDLYDTDLPTLEEAALLFGFARGISA